MNRYAVSTSLLVVVISANGLTGCNSQTSTTPAPATIPTADGHVDHAQNGGADMEKIKGALAKLSAEDAAAAEKQRVCPVSGEMLGSMGTPKKVEVNGRPVWICCESCRDKLLADPETYVAKLKKE